MTANPLPDHYKDRMRLFPARRTGLHSRPGLSVEANAGTAAPLRAGVPQTTSSTAFLGLLPRFLPTGDPRTQVLDVSVAQSLEHFPGVRHPAWVGAPRNLYYFRVSCKLMHSPRRPFEVAQGTQPSFFHSRLPKSRRPRTNRDAWEAH
jgi:hypothetical protein